MKSDTPVEELASAFYSALHRDLPSRTYTDYEGKEKEARPSVRDCEVYHFPQEWGSTALGFGGMGGSAMTAAYTTVVIQGNSFCVYFDGRFAYGVTGFNRTALYEDLKRFDMAAVRNAEKYDLKQKEPTQ